MKRKNIKNIKTKIYSCYSYKLVNNKNVITIDEVEDYLKQQGYIIVPNPKLFKLVTLSICLVIIYLNYVRII